MHELSIAMGIVEAAIDEARQRDVQVNAVHLRLGALSGVVKDALLFSYEVACQGTPLEGSRLVIEEVAVAVFCPQCKEKQRAGIDTVVHLSGVRNADWGSTSGKRIRGLRAGGEGMNEPRLVEMR